MTRKTRPDGHGTLQVHLPRNYCFACGKDNPDGMRLKFHYDRRRKRFVCLFRLGRRYTGPPGHAHGGVIATLLDEAMGKVNKLRHVVAMTRSMEVEYLKPVPLRRPLRVESWELRVQGRRHINVAEIRNGRGQVLARGQATFLAIDPIKMFARHLPRGVAKFTGVK
ncbi:MAG: PaaI family thioesterase [Terriglobales bacterium]